MEAFYVVEDFISTKEMIICVVVAGCLTAMFYALYSPKKFL